MLEVDEGCERSDVTYHTAFHNDTNLKYLTRRCVTVGEAKALEVDEGCMRDVTYLRASDNYATLK